MTETMKDQIRNWFAKDKEEQGKFPEYPSDEEGGSNLIFNPDAVIHDSDGETTRRDEKGKKEEKKEGEEEEEKGFRLGPSDFLTSLKEGDKTFSGESVMDKNGWSRICLRNNLGFHTNRSLAEGKRFGARG